MHVEMWSRFEIPLWFIVALLSLSQALGHSGLRVPQSSLRRQERNGTGQLVNTGRVQNNFPIELSTDVIVPETGVELKLINMLERTGASHGSHIKDLAKIFPSVCAGILGSLFVVFPYTRLAGMFILFFSLQSFMNLYTKMVLSEFEVAPGVYGIPIPFLMVVMQQVISVVVVVVMMALSRLTPWPIKPVVPKTRREGFIVVLLSFVFALNIGLNNLSVAILDISVNQMIRSTTPMMLPLVYFILNDHKNTTSAEDRLWLALGGLGVLGTLGAKASHSSAPESSAFGILVCVTSVFASCFELILIKLLAVDMKMTPVDTVLNVAIPAALFLVVPAFAVELPGRHGQMMGTNWVVFKEACRLSIWAAPLMIFSGVFAAFYNQFLYKLVSQFSPEHTAFASNANKLATIALSIMLGLEALPGGYNDVLLCFSVLFGCGSFAMFAFQRARADQKAN